MQVIRTLIVDDEVLARRRIKNLLGERAQFQVIGECANGREAVAAIENLAPDLVFLDVQMPDLDGFGVLKELESGPLPVIVFVTAYDRYALQAFEVHALDYLLKPFDDERFERTLEWVAKQLLRDEDQTSERMLDLIENIQDKRATPSRLVVRSAGRVTFVRTGDIDWIEAEGYYARLHVGEKSHLVRETMSSLESRLDPARFVRIHRSTIVNKERIKEMRSSSHGEYRVTLEGGDQLKMSRTYRDRLSSLTGDGK
jgi:two-component system LytT family response regulator